MPQSGHSRGSMFQPCRRCFGVVVPPKPVADRCSYSGNSYSTTPSHGVWTVATSTGLVELLPKERAQIYNRLDFEATECLRVDGIADVEEQNFQAVLRGLNIRLQPGETVHVSVAQRCFVGFAQRYNPMKPAPRN